MITAKDVVDALARITGGRIADPGTPVKEGAHPYILKKSSGIAGKAILEYPGLINGNPDKPIKTLGIGMTLTESMIELAGALGLDAVLVHHPVADAASSGGVPLLPYLNLYSLALFELHEAFHGLHPGIPFLHGHRVVAKDVRFGGIPGNIIFIGRALSGVETARDILDRLNDFMDIATEQKVLDAEIRTRACPDMTEASLAAGPKILNGSPDARVKHIVHIFPHTGFSVGHLEQVLKRYPETDTLIASISRVLPASELVSAARAGNLTLVIGNSHAHEIFENGLPLAYALARELSGLSLTMLRERMTASPLDHFGSRKIREYGRQMAGHLIQGDSNKK